MNFRTRTLGVAIHFAHHYFQGGRKELVDFVRSLVKDGRQNITKFAPFRIEVNKY